MISMDEKTLIAYFSRKGNNFAGESIVDLPVGNTEVVAKMIQEMTDGDVFRIETVTSYPADYTETTKVAQKELRDNVRPMLTGHVKDMDSYEVIFLGYPNWWGTFPRPVASFLMEYDFYGKIIAPFCTHEGSQLGRSVEEIKETCRKSTVLDGLAIRGGNAKNAQKEVSEWLKKLKAQGKI
ncbi:MAG: flavodoxin [Candidatus Altiarchaeota archaeon]